MKLSAFQSLILAITLFLGCGQEGVARLRGAESQHSMKGYELYSWEIRGEWYFSLVVGTNRLKTQSEITSRRVRVRGVEALKKRLNRLADGEEVFWSMRRVAGTVLPPDRIVEEVKSYCTKHGIILKVARRGVNDASNNGMHSTADGAAFTRETPAIRWFAAAGDGGRSASIYRQHFHIG